MSAVCNSPDIDADRLLSAALGELVIHLDQPFVAPIPRRLQLVKVGTAGLGTRTDRRSAFERFKQEFESHADRPVLIPAAYADAPRCDAPSVDEIIEWAVDTRCPAVLVDTHIKDGRGYWSWVRFDQHARWVEACRSAKILLAVAGSLDREGIDRLSEFPPDIVAVRGSACRGGDRHGTVVADRVRMLSDQVRSWSLSAKQESIG